MVDSPRMTSPGVASRLAADRLGGGEEALLQASLVEYFEQGLPEPKKESPRGDQVVVCWGRWGRTFAQTQVSRAGVP